MYGSEREYGISRTSISASDFQQLLVLSTPQGYREGEGVQTPKQSLVCEWCLGEWKDQRIKDKTQYRNCLSL